MTDKYLLVCGLYCIDELEGTNKGHYRQRSILLMVDDKRNKREEEMVVAAKGLSREERVKPTFPSHFCPLTAPASATANSAMP
ncbi:hypothetical protein V6N11_026022 [Hibiscus sabdariffa]|uniref:Uncharacterized protein n=1 Tax=Hibiscus sabdariffa TaxID=183260 RepID=A0ABR2SUF8_9ROSI